MPVPAAGAPLPERRVDVDDRRFGTRRALPSHGCCGWRSPLWPRRWRHKDDEQHRDGDELSREVRLGGGGGSYV